MINLIKKINLTNLIIKNILYQYSYNEKYDYIN